MYFSKLLQLPADLLSHKTTGSLGGKVQLWLKKANLGKALGGCEGSAGCDRFAEPQM